MQKFNVNFFDNFIYTSPFAKGKKSIFYKSWPNDFDIMDQAVAAELGNNYLLELQFT